MKFDSKAPPSLKQALRPLVKRYLLCLALCLLLSPLLVALIIPNLKGTRCGGNGSRAIGAIREINSAQAQFLERSVEQRYGSLTELGAAGLIDEALASGVKSGYCFDVSPDPEWPAYYYRVLAFPADWPHTGTGKFFSDQSSVVRYTRDGSVPTRFSKPIGE